MLHLHTKKRDISQRGLKSNVHLFGEIRLDRYPSLDISRHRPVLQPFFHPLLGYRHHVFFEILGSQSLSQEWCYFRQQKVVVIGWFLFQVVPVADLTARVYEFLGIQEGAACLALISSCIWPLAVRASSFDISVWQKLATVLTEHLRLLSFFYISFRLQIFEKLLRKCHMFLGMRAMQDIIGDIDSAKCFKYLLSITLNKGLLIGTRFLSGNFYPDTMIVRSAKRYALLSARLQKTIIDISRQMNTRSVSDMNWAIGIG